MNFLLLATPFLSSGIGLKLAIELTSLHACQQFELLIDIEEIYDD